MRVLKRWKMLGTCCKDMMSSVVTKPELQYCSIADWCILRVCKGGNPVIWNHPVVRCELCIILSTSYPDVWNSDHLCCAPSGSASVEAVYHLQLALNSCDLSCFGLFGLPPPKRIEVS